MSIEGDISRNKRRLLQNPAGIPGGQSEYKVLYVPDVPERNWTGVLLQTAFRFVPGGTDDICLRYGTLEGVMDATANIINADSGISRRTNLPGLLVESLPIAAGRLLEARYEDDETAISRRACTGIQIPRRVADFNRETLVGVLYRRAEALSLLQQRGIIIGWREVQKPAGDTISLTIPTDSFVLPPSVKPILEPHEIYAFVTALRYTEHGWLVDNLGATGALLRKLSEVQKSTAGAKGKLRDPESLRHLYPKLVSISKDPLAGAGNYQPGWAVVAEFVEGASEDLLREICSREIEISFRGQSPKVNA